MNETQARIATICDDIKTMLLLKNASYGNSALEPLAVFSKADTLERLNVRIDDKLSRLARGREYQGDDTELDLIGYLILRRVWKSMGGTMPAPEPFTSRSSRERILADEINERMRCSPLKFSPEDTLTELKPLESIE